MLLLLGGCALEGRVLHRVRVARRLCHSQARHPLLCGRLPLLLLLLLLLWPLPMILVRCLGANDAKVRLAAGSIGAAALPPAGWGRMAVPSLLPLLCVQPCRVVQLAAAHDVRALLLLTRIAAATAAAAAALGGQVGVLVVVFVLPLLPPRAFHLFVQSLPAHNTRVRAGRRFAPLIVQVRVLALVLVRPLQVATRLHLRVQRLVADDVRVRPCAAVEVVQVRVLVVVVTRRLRLARRRHGRVQLLRPHYHATAAAAGAVCVCRSHRLRAASAAACLLP